MKEFKNKVSKSKHGVKIKKLYVKSLLFIIFKKINNFIINKMLFI